MATQIDKRDVLDIADDIANQICTGIKQGINGNDVILIRNIVEECINDWISDAETEDAKNKWDNQDTMLNYDIELNPDR